MANLPQRGRILVVGRLQVAQQLVADAKEAWIAVHVAGMQMAHRAAYVVLQLLGGRELAGRTGVQPIEEVHIDGVHNGRQGDAHDENGGDQFAGHYSFFFMLSFR